MRVKTFIKQVYVIGLSQIAVRFIALLLVPILTNSLTKENYGLWSLTISAVTLLSTLTTFGLGPSVVRFGGRQDTQRNVYRTSLLSVLVISTILGVILYPLFISILGNSTLSGVAVFLLIFSSVLEIIYSFLRANKVFNLFSLSITIQNIGLFIIALVVSNTTQNVEDLALLLAMLDFILIFVLILKTFKPLKRPQFRSLIGYLKYGLPTIPISMFPMITINFTIILLSFYAGLNAVSEFSVANSVSMIISAAWLPLGFVIFPILVDIWEKKGKEQSKQFFENMIHWLFMLFIPALFGITALSKNIVLLMSNAQFLPAAITVPILSAMYLFNVFLIAIPLFVLSLAKKTHESGLVHLVYALLFVAVAPLVMKYYGVTGAAISLLIIYASLFLTLLVISRKYLKINFNVLKLTKILFSSAIMLITVRKITPEGLVGTVFGVIAGASIYVALLFITGILTKDDILAIVSKA